MFKQLLTPFGGNLALSFLVAAVPIATVLILLGVLRRPAAPFGMCHRRFKPSFARLRSVAMRDEGQGGVR